MDIIQAKGNNTQKMSMERKCAQVELLIPLTSVG